LRHFDTIPVRDGSTDRQTDGHADDGYGIALAYYKYRYYRLHYDVAGPHKSSWWQKSYNLRLKPTSNSQYGFTWRSCL